MSTVPSLWTRVGSWFRAPSGAGGVNGSASPPRSHADDSSATIQLGDLARRGGGIVGAVRTPPRDRRDATTRVVEMMDAMQEHFERQDQRARELNRAVDRVATILESLAQTQQAQADTLRIVAEQSTLATQHHQAVAHTLGGMPESLAAQADALRTVARRIELEQESEAQLQAALQRFGASMESVRAAGVSQVEALQSMHSEQREQQQALGSLIREHAQRSLVTIIIAGVVAMLGLAALGTAVAFLLDSAAR